MRVLLLNATYEPLRVITMKRAVALVLADKVDIVEEHPEAEVRSASTAMKAPSVIRLRYFVRIPYKSRLPLTRKTLMARDGGICQYCERKGDTIDHVQPRSRGGEHSWENVVIACRKCNFKKSDKLLSELGWELIRQPTTPRGTKWLILGVVNNDPVWEPYLAEFA